MTDSIERQRFARCLEILARLRRLPAELRAEALAEACGADAELRAEVESLLAVEPASFLDEEAAPGRRLRAEFDARGPGAAGPPAQVGPYRLLGELGEGGMATVYEAEQAQPRRRVALKILRHELATPAGRDRFEREAEFLARLAHPNVAQVLESGVHVDPGGRALPWMAMELVDGRPITEHADAEGLDRRARIALVLQACDAVGHANAQGIVHRDLKPENVLVDGSGRVRVLDFGVARALDGDERAPRLTLAGDVVGTLSYMSPEQACGDTAAVDARADVYALGVMTFELLCGRLPHDLARLSVAEALGRVRDIDAERLRDVLPDIEDDLDLIVSKSLEKERVQRYASVTALAQDLRRFLAHQPVAARRPSAIYQLTRFARRNRPVVAAVLGIMAVLIIAVAVTTRLAFREAAERRRADHQAAEALERESEARHAQYRAQLAAAAAALREGDVFAARRLLEEAPPDLRGWEWRRLDGSLDQSLALLHAPPGEALALGFSSDREHLTIATRSGLAQVRLDTLEGERLWSAPAGWKVVALAPDGDSAILEGGGGSALLNVPTGAIVTLTSRSLGSAGYSGSGLTAWTTERDEEGQPRVVLADVPSGDVRVELETPDGWVWFSVADRIVGHAMLGGGLRIWDVASGRPRDLPGPAGVNLLIDPTGRRALGLQSNGRTHGWDLEGGSSLDWRDVGEPLSVIDAGRFDPTGRRVVTMHSDGRARLLDADDGRPIATIAQADLAGVHCHPAFTPDGRLVAVASSRHGVLIVDAEDGRRRALLRGHDRPLLSLSLQRGGERLASMDVDGQVRLWEVSDTSDPTVLRGHESYVYGVALHPDGSRVASAAWDGTVRLWDTASGAALATLRSTATTPYYGQVAWSPGGARLLAAHGETLTLWNATTGELLDDRRLGGQDLPAGPHSEPTAIAWHPTGATVVVASMSRALQAFRIGESTEAIPEPDEWPARGEALAFSPDGRLVAISLSDQVELWDVARRELVRSLAGPTQKTRRVAFSPDGSLVAAVSDDGHLRTWTVKDGRPQLDVTAHSDQAHGLAWSPDGSRIATGGSDRTVRVWEARRGDLLAVLRGHQLYAYVLAWSADGELLVSGSGDGTVRLWDAAPRSERMRVRGERRRRLEELRPAVTAAWADAGSLEGVLERLTDRGGLDAAGLRIASDLVLELGAGR